MVVAVFAAAPALPSGVPMGVVAHIDAGTGTDTLGKPFSQKFPLVSAQGGDLIGQIGAPTAHLDLVYTGTDGSFSIPGGQARSFGDIKRTFFGTADKFAREFAFHYLVLADSYAAFEDFATDVNADGLLTPGVDTNTPDGVLTVGEVPNLDTGRIPRSPTPAQATVVSATPTTATVSGLAFPTVGPGLANHAVLVTSGAGAGQLRKIASTSGATLTIESLHPWSTVPSAGDTLVFLLDSSGLGEVDFRPAPNNHGAPGNDFLMTLGTFGVNSAGFLATDFIQWRTIVHELGHNFGLRHCGTKTSASACEFTPAVYESLMSYAHQLRTGTGVNSYSPRVPGMPDMTFDDWFHLRPDFSKALVHVGNTRRLGLGAGSVVGPGAVITSDDVDDIDPGLSDYEQANGPIDLEGPAINIIDPPSGSNILQGNDLTVTVSATDNVALGPVMVSFDIDGSGAIDTTGETVIATSSGPDEFEAMFLNASGPDGNRDIVASVSDTSTNMSQDIEPIFVPEPSVVLSLAVAVPLLGLLARRRRSGPR